MRGNVRQREIDNLAAAGELEDAIAWRRSLPVDEATNDLLAALAGSGGFGEDVVRATIDREADRDTLKRIAVALTAPAKRAGPRRADRRSIRPGAPRHARPRRSHAQPRVFGRVKETDEIAEWLSGPRQSHPSLPCSSAGCRASASRPSSKRPCGGPPRDPWVVVRLDFDRAGLEVRDWSGSPSSWPGRCHGAGRAGHDLRQARLEALAARPPDPAVKGEAREQLPNQLSPAGRRRGRRGPADAGPARHARGAARAWQEPPGTAVPLAKPAVGRAAPRSRSSPPGAGTRWTVRREPGRATAGAGRLDPGKRRGPDEPPGCAAGE